MRAFVLFCLVLVSSVSALDDVDIVGSNYHETVGIPTAEKILAYEEGILKNQSPLERIIGGKLVYDITPYPYFAGLWITLVDKRKSTCGASLVSANKLVTAAHCWRDSRNKASSVEVVLGSYLLLSGGTRIVTNQVILHPQWNPSELENDVGVITLPRNVEFNARIQPISLPMSSEVSLTFTGARAVAIGYGKTKDAQKSPATQASAVNLTVVSNKVCQQTYGMYARTSNICTSGFGNVGTCNGDSGGPLATVIGPRTVLIGIKSFGRRGHCEGGLPTVFARVTSFVDFINNNL